MRQWTNPAICRNLPQFAATCRNLPQLAAIARNPDTAILGFSAVLATAHLEGCVKFTHLPIALVWDFGFLLFRSPLAPYFNEHGAVLSRHTFNDSGLAAPKRCVGGPVLRSLGEGGTALTIGE